MDSVKDNSRSIKHMTYRYWEQSVLEHYSSVIMTWNCWH